MNPITLRVSEDLVSEIDSEADELGFSSRAEYLRHLLRHRSHTRDVIATDDTDPIVDPQAIDDNAEQIKALKSDLEKAVARIEKLEAKFENHLTEIDSTTDESTNTENATSSPAFSELEDWLKNDDNAPNSEDAVAVIKKAAEILAEDGPLETGELKRRLYQADCHGYSSEDSLWGSAIREYYQEAPGISNPEFGTYEFETNSE